MNNFTTEVFHLRRGVRQGCPLSPLLYILCVQVFALSIWADKEIKGIQINHKVQHKISQYADDTTLTVVGDDSIDRAFSHAATYINLDKCEGLWIGTKQKQNGQTTRH